MAGDLPKSLISPRLQNGNLTYCPFCGEDLKSATVSGRERIICISCEFVHWDNPQPVTAALVPYEGGLVLVQRKYEPFIGDWCLPGGFIEAYEDPAESARREVFEETGLTIKDQNLIAAAAPGRRINVIILFYQADSATGTLIAGDDAVDVRSFRQSELPLNICFELHRHMIEKWFEKQHLANVIT